MGGDKELRCQGRCPSNGEGCLLKIGHDFPLFNIAKPNKTCLVSCTVYSFKMGVLGRGVEYLGPWLEGVR